ncbi:hypothetical protein [Prevotella sp. OH937_COT-195]|uniref:hypothetical protein n=1 Tax=Prevotella sp. OH937_COT-195 TaxID=2491051 RepID=UPI0013157300|nr:hypothetical protein [Prevotella sp. OH937_COT-195]
MYRLQMSANYLWICGKEVTLQDKCEKAVCPSAFGNDDAVSEKVPKGEYKIR